MELNYDKIKSLPEERQIEILVDDLTEVSTGNAAGKCEGTINFRMIKGLEDQSYIIVENKREYIEKISELNPHFYIGGGDEEESFIYKEGVCIYHFIYKDGTFYINGLEMKNLYIHMSPEEAEIKITEYLKVLEDLKIKGFINIIY